MYTRPKGLATKSIIVIFGLLFLAHNVWGASCDTGAGVASDIFSEADKVSARVACRNLRVAVIAASRSNGQNLTEKVAKYAGCMVYQGFEDFSSGLQDYWNLLAGNKWATIGPREIEYRSFQTGTVYSPTKRTFVASSPLDSDSVTVKLLKYGGRAPTHVAVCSHGADGGSKLEYEITMGREYPNRYIWDPPEITGVLDRIISVQIDPAGTARRFEYGLSVSKGPRVEPVGDQVGSGGQGTGQPPGDAPPSTTSDGQPTQAGESTAPRLDQMQTQIPVGSKVNQPIRIDVSANGGELSSEQTDMSTAEDGQCLVTSTLRFPEIRLRCGTSPKDQVVRVAEDRFPDCPLIAGDRVSIEKDELTKRISVTGRIGGESCGRTFRPGYYSGPCYSERKDGRNSSAKTLFYKGRNIVEAVIPNSCEPARLSDGIYKVIIEQIESVTGELPRITLREGVFRLEGEEMVGDVTGLVSEPFLQN